MAILVAAGRATYQAAIKNRPIHLAWGSGDESWGSTPPEETLSSTALLNEVGRREALQVEFVTPDPAGVIEVPEGNFSISSTPTRYLFLDFHFAFADAATTVIREAAVFVDTVRAVGVSPSKAYLLPSEVDNPGRILVLEHLNPAVIRSPAVRERFQYVITL